ncbi:MAG: NAD-dependent epimerase/dehydratase family protein [Ilumatobacteraceae bacterium]
MTRVLLTGGETPLGLLLAARLRDLPGVSSVVLADVAAGIDTESIDTVVHAGMCPGRSGAAATGGADVIATQRLAAALSDRGTPVRAVVAVSSSEVYVPLAAAPQWRREDEPLTAPPGSGAARVLEAEGYLRDLAEHQPHVCVAILRLAELAGPGMAGELAALWRRPLVPFVAGYDPQVQALHVDDALAAIEHAAIRELAGTMNVASRGTTTWRHTARLAGHPITPAIVASRRWAEQMSRVGAPCVASSAADLLRFGRCLDTTAIEATGFTPQHDVEACVRAAVT